MQLPAGYDELWGTATNGEGVRRLGVLMGRPETVEDSFLKSCRFSTHTSTHTLLGLSGTSKKDPWSANPPQRSRPLVLLPITFLLVLSREE